MDRKTFLRGTLATLTASILMTGCIPGMGGKAQPEEPDFRCKQDGQLAPKWTCNPYREGAVVALGIAPTNAGNDYSMQMAEALADGRDGLANQLSVKVNTMFKSFKATTGSGEASTYDKATSKVSKQLASQTLQGSRAIETWKSGKGNLYVLVGISNEPVKNAMEDAVKTSFKNDKAMYQKFLAAKADGELDKELEKAGME